MIMSYELIKEIKQMSMEKSLKKILDEILDEVQKELDEFTTTGNVASYQTPLAVSDKKDKVKKRKKKSFNSNGLFCCRW